MNKPLIIGHRGAMGHAPENTLASFDLGRRMGADFLECDVHLSKDKKLVVLHDETLDRTTSGTGLVGKLPWSKLKKLDAGAWFHRKFRGQKILTLDDLLAWIKPKRSASGLPLRFVLELKTEYVPYLGIEEAAVKALNKFDMGGRTIVISFNHGSVKRVKILDRALRAGILFHEPLPDLLARVKAMRADGIFPRRHLVTPAMARFARKHKLFLGTWTVNEPDEMKKMVRLGVDAVATNFPDRLAKIIG